MKKTTIISGLLLSTLLNAQSFTQSPTPLTAPVNTGYLLGGGVLVSDPSDVTNVEAGSVHCGTGGIHADNAYWRFFDLGALGAVEVTDVDIGIETATGGAGSQPIVIRLHSIANGDAFPGGTLTLVSEVATTIADASAEVVNFPISAMFDSSTDDLVMEVFTPDGDAETNGLFIGSNTSAEVGVTFLSADACGITDPTAVGDIGFPDMHVIMVVNGMAGVPVELMNFSIE